MDERTFHVGPLGQLPPVMRVLFVTELGDDSLEACFAEDSAVAVKLDTEALSAAVARLRVDNYDVLILEHAPGVLDALATLSMLRTVAPGQPLIVMGDSPSEELEADCLESHADAYVCRAQTNVRTLLWVLARAIERQRLLEVSHSLRNNLKSQQRQHQQSVLCQLRAQKSLLMELPGADPEPPAWLTTRLLDLLKVYVVAGNGNPDQELAEFIASLQRSQVTLHEALLAHTFATEELVLGLGQRPAWHIVSRANLMAYAMMLRMRRDTGPADTGRALPRAHSVR